MVALSRRATLVVVIAVCGLGVGLLCRVIVSEAMGDLVMLGAAIVIGELLELKPPQRAPIPLSFAVFVVLARDADALQFVVTLVAAELVATALRPRTAQSRFRLLADRLLCGAAAGLVFDAVARDDSRNAILGGALCSIIGALALAEVLQRIPPRRLAAPQSSARLFFAGRTADLTIVSSAVLMAASFGGVDGAGDLGLSGVVLFSIPALMAMYSFERLAKTRSAYDQTIDALATIPEVGGWVMKGRSHRVADLVIATGEGLGLGPADVDRLCSAALLRDLGRVCLDEPTTTDTHEVLRVSAAVLSASPTLTPAGAVLTAELHPDAALPADRIAGEVLATCSAFEDATRGAWLTSRTVVDDGVRAIAPDHDPEVVGALRRGLDRRLPE